MPKNLVQIWGLFASILVIFICYSSFKKPLKWNFDIKQTNTKKIFNNTQQKVDDLNKISFTDTSELPNLSLNPNSAQEAQKPAAQSNYLSLNPDNPVAVVDFPKDAFKHYDLKLIIEKENLYILLAGDSMTEELRHGLATYCDKNGYKLMTCTWYSSNTEIWSQSNKLSNLIAEYQPDMVIFTLGSNELFRKDIADREQYIQDIIYESDRTKTPFIWVNPPAWKDDTGISELIKKNVGIGRYFDSRGIKMGRKSDGAHPTRDGAQVWADTIVKYLKKESHYKAFFADFNLDLKNSTSQIYKLQGLDTTLSARKAKILVRILKDTDPAANNLANVDNNNANVLASKGLKSDSLAQNKKVFSINPEKNPTKSLQDPTKSLQDPTKSLQDPTKSLQDSTKSLQDPTKSLQDPTKSLQDPTNPENNRIKSDSSKGKN